MKNENTVPKQAGSTRFVLVREVKDAPVVGGKHVGAVWRTGQNQIRCNRDASISQPVWNSFLVLNCFTVLDTSVDAQVFAESWSNTHSRHHAERHRAHG